LIDFVAVRPLPGLSRGGHFVTHFMTDLMRGKMKSRAAISIEDFFTSLKAFPTRDMALAESRKAIDQYHRDNPGMPPVFVALLSDAAGWRGILNPGDARSQNQITLIAVMGRYQVEYVPEANVPGGKDGAA
jgi:hypothetical protein